jgi:disulfide bond formation protein DsbB
MRFFADSGPTQTRMALFLTVAMTAIIAAVWAFEYSGYAPCQLCLEQRKPYYIAIPILATIWLVTVAGLRGPWLRGALAITALCLLATAAIAAYHAGVEWGWFEAPETCGAGITGEASDASSLLESLSSSVPPKCDDAAGRFLGLSFAGWNVVASLPLAWLAAHGAFAKAS